MDMVDDATSTVLCRLGTQETIWAAVGVLRAWIGKYGVPRRVIHGLEERIQAAGHGERAGVRRSPVTPVWADVPRFGDRDHCRQFAAGERAGGEKPRDPSGSVGEEATAQRSDPPGRGQ